MGRTIVTHLSAQPGNMKVLLLVVIGSLISWSSAADENCGDSFFHPYGRLSSSNYPNGYENNLDCYALLGSGPRVQLRFYDFATEPNFDYVIVYDGPTTSSPIIANITGYSFPPEVVSTGTQLLLRFITDEINNERGWSGWYGPKV